MTVAPAASLDRVTLRLGERVVLDDVSLVVPDGGVTALVGPNGCGKSTIARMLTGFLFPTRGVVTVLGHRLGSVNVHDLRRRVKLVQPTALHEPAARATVRDVVATGAFGTVDLHDDVTPTDAAVADGLLARFGLSRLAGAAYRTCSSGERMRAQLARAMMSGPRLLILDEPTSGLDIPMRESFLSTLDAMMAGPSPPAVLLVTHHLEELPTSARHAVLMADARVAAAGRSEDVLTSAAMSAAFAYPINVTERSGRFAAHLALSATP